MEQKWKQSYKRDCIKKYKHNKTGKEIYVDACAMVAGSPAKVWITDANGKREGQLVVMDLYSNYELIP